MYVSCNVLIPPGPVNEEEAARYVAPASIGAKIWDWLSESKEQVRVYVILLIVICPAV